MMMESGSKKMMDVEMRTRVSGSQGSDVVDDRTHVGRIVMEIRKLSWAFNMDRCILSPESIILRIY